MAGESSQEELQSVRLVRVDMKFLDMVNLFIKASFAAALAAVLTSVLWIMILLGFGFVLTVLTTILGIGASAAL